MAFLMRDLLSSTVRAFHVFRAKWVAFLRFGPPFGSSEEDCSLTIVLYPFPCFPLERQNRAWISQIVWGFGVMCKWQLYLSAGSWDARSKHPKRVTGCNQAVHWYPQRTMRNIDVKSLLISVLTTVLVFTPLAMADNWPAWRGPNHTGASTSGKYPTDLAEPANLAW